MQSLIREERWLTVVSFLVVFVWLLFWLFSIHANIVSPVRKPDYPYEDLVSLSLQKQLFWAVVALSSFVGYFEFLGVVKGERKSFIWVYEVVFGGFAFALTVSVTRIADQIKWVAGLEKLASIPIESPSTHEAVLVSIPFLVFSVCLLIWFVYLCLLIDKMKRKNAQT